jgi:oxygen-independent coproporphyrinogen-3 oxidase
MSGNFENTGWCVKDREGLYNICIMEELHTILSLGAGGVTKLVDARGGLIERIFNPKYPYEYISGIDDILKNGEKLRQFYRERHILDNK